MIRNIVMSDTGGWLPQLLNTFDALGIDAKESTMPENMRVIHCGDLIHKGPYSSQLLAVVTGLIVKNPTQWVQLLGNHEIQHIPGAPMFWPCNCTREDVGLLNLLTEEGLMKPTFGLTARGRILSGEKKELAMFFAHGGLTHGFWRSKTSGAIAPEEASRVLNELPIEEITVPGMMLGEDKPFGEVGPVWAVGNTEVFQDWQQAGEPMPFIQFHGHTVSYSFDRNQWWQDLEGFRKHSKLLPASRTVITELNNNLMLGVDPGFNMKRPTIAQQPWFEFYTES